MAVFEEVELGVLEECSSPTHLTSPYYPSKVGGKVAWLDPVNLPTSEQLKCKKCSKPCVLLLQIYAPLSDSPETFHRSVFVFVCLDSKCHTTSSNEPFRVFRSSLPQMNPYYHDPPDDDEESDDKDRMQSPAIDTQANVAPVCFVCGGWAPQKCGSCQKVHYCSRDHQKSDWTSGHKKVCKDLVAGTLTPDEIPHRPGAGVLLHEMEIVTKSEPKKVETPERTATERMADYYKLINTEGYGKSQLVDAGPETLTQATRGLVKEDKMFRTFKKQIALEPKQVLRFQPGGNPLLVREEESQDLIPPCSSCGSTRQFEFQIMPQLLYFLKLETSPTATIDWATLLVYTCASNCHAAPGYREEFLLKQDF